MVKYTRRKRNKQWLNLLTLDSSESLRQNNLCVRTSPVLARKGNFKSLWPAEFSPKMLRYTWIGQHNLIFIFLAHFICRRGGRMQRFCPPCSALPASVLTPHVMSFCFRVLRVWDGGGRKGVSWNNAAQPPVLLAVESPLRVSMATHSLGNPPSSSRWGDDAVVCLCQMCKSPLCEPVCVVYVFPSDGEKQINDSVMHKLKWNASK